MNREKQAQVPLVSIIVPIYNVEEYLEQCLDSLQRQSLKNIEVILIDDGSTDGSGVVCDRYAARDPRFKVIHKKNEGLSAARNDGIKISCGKYIMFVDGDDWVEPDFCKTPYMIAQNTGSEIIAFQRMPHPLGKKEKQVLFPKEGLADKKTVLTEWWSLTGVVVWNKLYYRRLFDDILFPAGRLSEDTAITHLLIERANSVYLLNECLYHHRVHRPGSILTEQSIKLREDQVTFNLQRIHDLRRWGYIGKEEEEKTALSYYITIGREGELSARCKEILKDCKGIKSSRKQNVLFLVYKFSPRIFDFVCILTGKRIKLSSESAHR